MDVTVRDLLLTWTWRPDVVTVLGGSAIAYVVGWRRLRRRDARAVSWWRLTAYLGGIGALALALLSAIDWLGSLLFFVHMIQHEVLMMAAPPLLLLGDPLPVVLWALPPEWRRAAAQVLAPGARVRRLLRTITWMPVTWPLFVVTLWGWHTPAAYEASLGSEFVHNIQHVSFFTAALLFWWPLINPAPRLHGHIHHALRVVYAVPAAFQSQLLGLILAFFSTRALYPHYEAVPRLWGFSALQDQTAAGLLMMQVEGLVYLAVVLLQVAALLRHEEQVTRQREELGLEP